MSDLYVNGISKIENLELVLFDKDGTLIDVHHYWVSMIKIRSNLIVKRWFELHDTPRTVEAKLSDAMGVDLEVNRIKHQGPVGIKPRHFIVNLAADIVRANSVNISNKDMEELFLEVDKRTSENLLPLLRLLPGVEMLLKQLKDCDVSAAIVSNDITSRTKIAMNLLGIKHYFCSILGGDAVENTKPSPDLAELTMKQGTYSLEHTVVVGDHPVDIEMGLNAGITTNIGVLTGLSSQAVFDDFVCTVVKDLRAIEVRC